MEGCTRWLQVVLTLPVVDLPTIVSSVVIFMKTVYLELLLETYSVYFFLSNGYYDIALLRVCRAPRSDTISGLWNTENYIQSKVSITPQYFAGTAMLAWTLMEKSSSWISVGGQAHKKLTDIISSFLSINKWIMKNAVFWDEVRVNWRFGGTYHLHLWSCPWDQWLLFYAVPLLDKYIVFTWEMILKKKYGLSKWIKCSIIILAIFMGVELGVSYWRKKFEWGYNVTFYKEWLFRLRSCGLWQCVYC
jgi:hypothetical protein